MLYKSFTKSKIIINLSKPDTVNFELINTFKASDPYDTWVYTTDSNNSKIFYYNVPNEDYGNIILNYDPFILSSDNTFTVGTLSQETINELTYAYDDPMYLLSKNYYHLDKLNNVKRLVYTSSIGAFPSAEVFREEDDNSAPPMDMFPGWAKRMAELQIKAQEVQRKAKKDADDLAVRKAELQLKAAKDKEQLKINKAEIMIDAQKENVKLATDKE